MPTVSQAVQILERVTDVPPATIKAVARKLLDDDLLPKSYGKKIAQVRVSHMTILLIALYTSKTIREASATALEYSTLPLFGGRMYYPREAAPHKALAIYERRMLSSGTCASDCLNSVLLSYLLSDDTTRFSSKDSYSAIEICTSYPEIVLTDAMSLTNDEMGVDERIVFKVYYRERGASLKNNRSQRPATSVRIPSATFAEIAGEWMNLHPELANMSGHERSDHIVGRARSADAQPAALGTNLASGAAVDVVAPDPLDVALMDWRDADQAALVPVT